MDSFEWYSDVESEDDEQKPIFDMNEDECVSFLAFLKAFVSTSTFMTSDAKKVVLQTLDDAETPRELDGIIMLYCLYKMGHHTNDVYHHVVPLLLQ